MKIGLSDDTARKALDLIPADTQDQDLVQLRTRLETGLKANTAAGTLNPAELDALIAAARHVLTVKSSGAGRVADQLNTAIPKLEALLSRRRAEAASGT